LFICNNPSKDRLDRDQACPPTHAHVLKIGKFHVAPRCPGMRLCRRRLMNARMGTNASAPESVAISMPRNG